MIEFASQNEFELGSESNTERWLKSVALKEGYGIGELNYVFCDDEYLLDLNKRYLDHDTFTDIITFDYTENDEINGEVYISIDRVGENAETYNASFDDELNRVMVHGLLHLCGYADKTEEEKAGMRSKENEYLKLADQ